MASLDFLERDQRRLLLGDKKRRSRAQLPGLSRPKEAEASTAQAAWE